MPLPQHIAIIMDGNRRWARRHGLAIIKGHRRVADELLERLADHCIVRGIPYLTLWAFSTENWQRPAKEVTQMLVLFRELLQKNVQKLHEKGIRLRAIGDVSRFPTDIQRSLQAGIEQTKDNQRLTLTFGLNYGGRDELVRAVRHVAGEVVAGRLEVVKIDEAIFSRYLDTAELPDPDLIIRPGGEQRLSGFLLWQSAYAELYFSPVLMPDFGPAELDQAIAEFQRRRRRYGR